MVKKADYLFELSWEVCNKVGGIYTVLQSKARKLVEHYKEDYFLIGPYFADKVAGQFLEELIPVDFKSKLNELKGEGIICHYGRWLIEGKPRVILIDFREYRAGINDIKRELWERFKIDSLRAGQDYDEPVSWAYACGKVLEKLSDVMKDKKIVAHFHEWLAGAALLYIKKKDVKITTVFSTHATVLGRTLASNNVDVYCKDASGKCVLEVIDINKEAYNSYVESKHLLEKASCQNADVFTTVSEITAIEAGFILGRKADILTPNGLDLTKFPTFEEISISHRLHKDQIREFLLYYFFPYYSFDLDETLFYFLAGRYEFRDKGIDIYIRALSKLNAMLKNEKSRKTIVAFIWVPANIRAIKAELLENKILFQDIRDTLEKAKDDAWKKILYAITAQKKLAEKTIFDEKFLFEMRKRTLKLKKKAAPSLVTHDLIDQNDIIIKHLFQAGLDNQQDDRVKIIFYPIYLTGADGLLNLTYYEAMSGSHLGVFPSFYEPWGYTPLEAAALGVSSVTTDLAGFGLYIRDKAHSEKRPGIFVLKRKGRKDDEIVKDLANFMHQFANLSKEERVQNKLEAKRLAHLADWEILINNYIKAHELAVERMWKS